MLIAQLTTYSNLHYRELSGICIDVLWIIREIKIRFFYSVRDELNSVENLKNVETEEYVNL